MNSFKLVLHYLVSIQIAFIHFGLGPHQFFLVHCAAEPNCQHEAALGAQLGKQTNRNKRASTRQQTNECANAGTRTFNGRVRRLHSFDAIESDGPTPTRKKTTTKKKQRRQNDDSGCGRPNCCPKRGGRVIGLKAAPTNRRRGARDWRRPDRHRCTALLFLQQNSKQTARPPKLSSLWKMDKHQYTIIFIKLSLFMFRV